MEEFRTEGGPQQGLYDPRFEHDACGIGCVVDIKGRKSHATVDNALKIVEKLEHRAGKDAAGKTGDGVGILLQISHRFFSRVTEEQGIHLGGERDYGIGMFFFPQDTLKRNQAKKMFEIIVEKEGMKFLGWRKVPIQPDTLGEKALSCMPYIEQGFVERPRNLSRGLDFDRRLYVARREFEQSNDNTYVVSCSSRTVVYKGMFLVGQLRKFYPDLQDADYESAIAMVHSRFSTNTNPSWERAHPNRFILHNGEINTIRGNADRMLSREETMSSDYMSADDLDKVFPVVNAEGSDSAMLDNTLEFMVMNGMPLPLAVMVCIPEPWSNDENMSRAKRDLYQYYATMMEPWDGPASILFSDGDCVGAVLDRNGLRPSRYYITDDDQLILSSEVGVLEIAPEKIVKKSRLQPGKMLLVDTVAGRLIGDDELKETYARHQPYGEWLDQNLVSLNELTIPNKGVASHTQEQRDRLYKAFGYTYEDVKTAILPMAQAGAEPTSAMGIDIPLAVLSENHQPLFNYFKQLFAQVTNPPIDAIREKVVTDTTVYVGSGGNLLREGEANCRALQIENPILTSVDLLKIKNMKKPGFQVETVSMLYYKNTPLKRALDQLFVAVDKAYRHGANIIILSDRGVDENHVAIPSLLAVSAIEDYLIRTKKRTALSLILESAEPRDVHHFATLLGYGATAINPYLALECIGELINVGLLDKDFGAAINDYCTAIKDGIVKIASKMGISTLQSYRGAQIFEAIGLSQDVVDQYFTNTVTRVGGIGLKEIEEIVNQNHNKAFDPLGLAVDTTLDSHGDHKSRQGLNAEDHLYNPATIHLLQRAAQTGDYQLFKQYTALVDDENKPHTLRGLLDFRFAEDGGVPIDEVESVDSIVKHFKTGAMSYGSISQEAHECLAVAMNHLGGKSNTGEGGENPERLRDPERNSQIKQVASGRFGVTSEYLVSANEIQIKMAQGAKPGEGGHLPAQKVYPWIAKTRYSTPGVSLISPPPHHDIYSIEDLAQLIYDLKNANRQARISVKLCSEAGVGTIAAGVAKAGAQVILIAGYDGGTGAAPKTSIHNAGLPWELGLAETHQTLIQNDLRSRVVIETDGKLMSGRDVVIAALLGAEEFGFATAPLVTMGCVMMRVCNLDTCPVGIATQNPELRKRFKGKPEYVENFMRFIAQEMREIMAKLGVRTLAELTGRSDLLKVREHMVTKRAAMVDLSRVLDNTWQKSGKDTHFIPEKVYDFKLEDTVDESILLEKMGKALKKGKPMHIELKVSSTDRTLGTIFGSEITRLHGSSLSDDTYTIKCYGGGGQSFGAFIPKGLTLELEGDSNDYLGKGLSGGKIIVYPPKASKFVHEENIIIGNVALYGATSGKAFINGVAGERFCVRNSGATAVVEGTGDHGCEYMTGGRVVVLGRTGKNFAAGMSGGIAYVLDEDRDLYLRVNKSLVSMSPVTQKFDIEELRGLIAEHVAATGSPLGKRILDNFEDYLPSFKKILPHDYSRMMQTIAQFEEKGMTREQAEIDAFYACTQQQ
ncbi:MAG: glutamate synthase large subunit [Eubacteriales bacterium]|nr:glutamate synthase large subunit [Eubacteriales bacterium]